MLFTSLLVIHNLLRWVVIAFALAAVGQGIVGLATGERYVARHRIANLGFVASLHFQVVLGLVFWLGLSPMMSQAIWPDFGGAMKVAHLRFWAVEHVAGMVLGAVVATVGSALARRAKRDRRRHLATVLGLGLGFLIVLASIPWPGMAAGRPLFRWFMW
jgi:hypothetical protein